MPNLKQLINLKEEYSQGIDGFSTKDAEIILESFDPKKITKSFSFHGEKVQGYIDFFKERRKTEAVLLFIDVTSFSTKFKNKNSDDVSDFLDNYYDRVIPTIYAHGGEIEKIMGDGIICVFGEPFLRKTKLTLHRKAEKCAMDLIHNNKGTEYELKVAFHYGEIMYYQNKSIDYTEFTMIGNAITELFRLESVSVSNSINFFGETDYEDINIDDVINRTPFKHAWTLKSPIQVKLKGVDKSYFRYLKAI